MPHAAGWQFEVKRDGFRALVSTEDGLRVRNFFSTSCPAPSSVGSFTRLKAFASTLAPERTTRLFQAPAIAEILALAGRTARGG